MAPKYKLSYFNARGLTEPSRLILAYAKIDFEDFRFEREDWPEIKKAMPWGQVPTLEFDGIIISQSKAIARFLANRHGLAGATDVENGKCDEYVDVLDDVRLEFVKWFREEDTTKKAELLKALEDQTVPKYMGKFNELLSKSASGWLVGNKITYADIFLANFSQGLSTGTFLKVDFANFPNVLKHQEAVLGQPGIKEWIDKRPKTQF